MYTHSSVFAPRIVCFALTLRLILWPAKEIAFPIGVHTFILLRGRMIYRIQESRTPNVADLPRFHRLGLRGGSLSVQLASPCCTFGSND